MDRETERGTDSEGERSPERWVGETETRRDMKTHRETCRQQSLELQGDRERRRDREMGRGGAGGDQEIKAETK